MKILTAAEMREADRLTTERYGISEDTLMESAGSGVAAAIAREVPDFARRKIIVLCGKGNNGGDGFVVARHLIASGAKPEVFLFAKPEAVSGVAAENLRRLRGAGGNVRAIADASAWETERRRMRDVDIVVDALLGTGLSGPVTGLLAKVIEDVNSRGARSRVMAVDTPSGLPSDTSAAAGPVVRADWTVTFTAPKVGQMLSPDCDRTGKLFVQAIGTPEQLVEEIGKSGLRWIEPGEFSKFPLRRKADSNKGMYGHVLVVAGSRGKAGAAALSGWGALRSGAGLVTVATPKDALPTVAGYLPELMTAELEQTEAGTASLANFEYGRFAKLAKDKTVVAIGPGVTTETETQQFVRKVVAECPLPIVVDADALNALAAAEPQAERASKGIALTPHPGEMARLLGITVAEVQRDRIAAARTCAKKYKAHVVLKGFHTIVASVEGDVFVNSTGNPGMATAGTGDVLTGIAAALTAQFGIEDWNRVLALAVYLHGLAGDFAAARYGEQPMTASDLIEAIPAAFSKLLNEVEELDGR